MNYNSKLSVGSSEEITTMGFCFACYTRCDGSCAGTCGGGCNAMCADSCRSSCTGTCTSSNLYAGHIW